MTSSAFAEAAPPESEKAPTVQKIDYSLQLLVDGKGSNPAGYRSVYQGDPIYLKSTLGENPYSGEKERVITFNVFPKITKDGLNLKGVLTASVGGKELQRSQIASVLKNGKPQVFAFDMEGRHYELVLRASY